jgi:hypothetical protein
MNDTMYVKVNQLGKSARFGFMVVKPASEEPCGYTPCNTSRYCYKCADDAIKAGNDWIATQK